MSIDPRADRAVFRQIADALRAEIDSGQRKPGSKLPSESQLMDLYNTSQLTVRRALGVLTEAGLIEKKKGVGAFVRVAPHPVKERHADRFHRRYWQPGHTVFDWDRGPSVDQRVIEATEVAAPEDVADALGLDEETMVFVRRRIINTIATETRPATPMQLADSYFPLDVAKGAIRDPNVGGVTYMTIESHGLRLTRLVERLRVRRPKPEESEKLRLGVGTPVVALTRIAYARPDEEPEAEERPVECFKAVMVGERYVFEYEIPVI